MSKLVKATGWLLNSVTLTRLYAMLRFWSALPHGPAIAALNPGTYCDSGPTGLGDSLGKEGAATFMNEHNGGDHTSIQRHSESQ